MRRYPDSGMSSAAGANGERNTNAWAGLDVSHGNVFRLDLAQLFLASPGTVRVQEGCEVSRLGLESGQRGLYICLLATWTSQ